MLLGLYQPPHDPGSLSRRSWTCAFAKASRGLGTRPQQGPGAAPRRVSRGQRPLCRVTTRPASRGSGAQPAQPAGEPTGPTDVSSSSRPQNTSPVASLSSADGCFFTANTACSPFHQPASCRTSPQDTSACNRSAASFLSHDSVNRLSLARRNHLSTHATPARFKLTLLRARFLLLPACRIPPLTFASTETDRSLIQRRLLLRPPTIYLLALALTLVRKRSDVLSLRITQSPRMKAQTSVQSTGTKPASHAR